MASAHVLIVDDSCVDRLVASRVIESCNIKGARSTMNFPSAINLL